MEMCGACGGSLVIPAGETNKICIECGLEEVDIMAYGNKQIKKPKVRVSK